MGFSSFSQLLLSFRGLTQCQTGERDSELGSCFLSHHQLKYLSHLVFCHWPRTILIPVHNTHSAPVSAPSRSSLSSWEWFYCLYIIFHHRKCVLSSSPYTSVQDSYMQNDEFNFHIILFSFLCFKKYFLSTMCYKQCSTIYT